MKKRLGAALLALTMLLSLCPLYALAAEEETDVYQETVNYVPDTEYMPDNDELFAVYVQMLLYPDVDLSSSTYSVAGNQLTGLDKVIYDKLKEKIAEIAAGTVTDTTIKFQTSELGINKTSWTIEELKGKDESITDSAEKENLDKAIKVVEEQLEYNGRAILDALLVDCPYELYWYDKTIGWSAGSSGYSYATSNGTLVSITIPDTFTFIFQVAKDYAADYVDGKSNTTTSTASIGERAANAKKNAIAIVNGVDATATDLERLTAYKNEICKLVSYDYDAVKSDYKPSYGYGDPWQLIRVFDGVSETSSSTTPSEKNAKKVVCEGYSKAFQYLCDLTNSDATNGSFSGDVDCYIITGYMGGGTGAGGHMWNRVKIGGEYYLVDVTNCDDGSVGTPDNLFMVGGPKVNDEDNIIATLSYSDGTKFIYYTNYQFTIGSTIIRYSFDEDANKWGNEPVLTLSEKAKYVEPVKVTPHVAQAPTATATYGQTLKDAALTGGSVVVSAGDKTPVAGTWSWVDDTQSVGNVSGSTPATFKAKFTPNDQTAYKNVPDVEVAVTVNAKSLTESMVTLTGADNLVYDGNAKTPAVIVRDGSTTLVENTDYTKSYSKNTDAGAADDASVTIEGKGNYTGSVTKTFSIAPKPLANSMIKLGTQNTYDGIERKIVIESVKDGGKDLTEGTDYTVTSGGTATNVGNTALTITGAGNYSGTATATWTLQKAVPTLNDFTLPTLEASDYTGNAISVDAPVTGKTGMGAVTVKYGDSTTAPTNAGNYAVTFDVAEGANYKAASGLTIGTLKINKADYTGEKTQAVTVRSNQEASGQTLSLPALPAGASYGAASVTDGSGLITVTPNISGTTLTYSVNSKAAGTTGTVTIPVNGGTNYNDYSIEVTFTAQAKEDAGVTVTPASATVKFGETVTITASNAKGGTGTWSWNYPADSFEAVGATNASSITLKAIKFDSGAKTVTAKFENEDYTGSAEATVSVSKAAAAVSTAPTAKSGLTYTGEPQTLVNAGAATGGELQYSVNGSAYTATVPTGTNAGSYTVKYKAVGDADHEDSDGQTITVAIAKAEPDVGTVSKSAPDKIYPHTALDEITLAKTGSAAGELVLNAGQTLTGGTKNYNWTFTPDDTDNYNIRTGTVSLTVTEDKLAGIAVKTAPTKTAYKWGEELALDGAVIEAAYDSGAKKEITADKLDCSKALTVGQDKVTVSYTEDGVTKTCDITGLTVSKADARTLADVTVSQKHGVDAEQTVSLGAAGMPSDAGTLSYTKGTEITTGAVTLSGWSVDSAAGEVKYTLSGGAAGDTVTLPVTIASTNYADSVVNIKIVLTDKNVPSVTVQNITRTYTGEAVPSTEITGAAVFDGNPVAGVWSWKETGAVTNVADSGVKTVVFTPTDTDTYAAVEANLTLTINKATPTGTPAYTPITAADKTLADAALTAGTITPAGGTIAWNDGDSTAVEANTAYGWIYTPGDTANYNNLTGSITPYQRSSGGSTGVGGGSSGTGTSTSTTTNADGSTTTKTENKTTGTVTETTKNTDGSQTVVETKKDGTVTTTETDRDGNTSREVQSPDGSSELTVKQKDGTTATVTTDAGGKSEAEVKLPQAVVSAAQESGEAIALPIPEVKAAKDAEAAPVVTVSTGSKEPVKVEIPTADITPGTVAVIVNADGSEEVIKSSVATADGVAVALPDGATVKIVDNSKDFDDVSDAHWANDAVDFASARELFSGTGETTFSPEESMTRAMLVTVLARYDGEDTAGGDTWYEKGMNWAVANGISDGSNPNAGITREQLAVMLWRYSGSPAASADLNSFADANEVSDYAQEAMRWAVENGIINGFGNGQLGPKGQATRAQVAQMLKNFVERQ